MMIFHFKKDNMKIFAASNFILLRYPEKEKKFRTEVTNQYGYCGRLFSYFFRKENKRVYERMMQEQVTFDPCPECGAELHCQEPNDHGDILPICSNPDCNYMIPF